MKYKISIICFNLIILTLNNYGSAAVATSYSNTENCTHCMKRYVEQEKRIHELEGLCRNYRDELAKWMKMYYEAKESCVATIEKWIKLAGAQAEKLMNLCAKYTSNKC